MLPKVHLFYGAIVNVLTTAAQFPLGELLLSIRLCRC